MSVNKVILIGNAGNNPETRQFENGMIATVSIATSERWTDKQTGERKEHTEWHRLVFNGRLAEVVAQYVQKGAKIYVEGSLRTRKWTDQQTGQERYSTEIRVDTMQMLGGQQQQTQGQQTQQAPQQGYQQPAQQQGQRYATHANGAPVFPPQPLPNGQVMQPAQAVSNDDIPF